MISNEAAIAAAQRLYLAFCDRLKKRPRDTDGEVMFAEGLKIAALFDSNGKLAAFYRVVEDRVVDFDGAETVRLRPRLTNRKVRG